MNAKMLNYMGLAVLSISDYEIRLYCRLQDRQGCHREAESYNFTAFAFIFYVLMWLVTIKHKKTYFKVP
jgi:hypothetical protein